MLFGVWLHILISDKIDIETKFTTTDKASMSHRMQSDASLFLFSHRPLKIHSQRKFPLTLKENSNGFMSLNKKHKVLTGLV
jgi:hypothetical protein